MSAIKASTGDKPKLGNLVLLAGLLIGGTLIGIDTALAQDASLLSTLEWMNDTYNPSQDGSFGYGEVEITSEGKLLERITDTISNLNCLFTLHTKEILFGTGPVKIIDNVDYTFDLKDIDPASLTTEQKESGAAGLLCSLVPDVAACDTSELQFETFDDKPLIKTQQDEIFPYLSGKDHDSKGSGTTFVGAFYLNDLSYATRFGNAFRHAVELCGGKPSPF